MQTINDRGSRKRLARIISCSTLLGWSLFAQVADAGPADKVYTPIVEQGELEIELRGGDADHGRVGHERAFVAGIGYGLSPRWFSELAVEYDDSPEGSGEIEALEWENIVQLTEQGRYWVDIGLFAEYELALESGMPDEIVFGPMFQKDVGLSQINLNLLLERQIGTNADSETEVGYAAQIKWRGNPKHELGVQAFGEENDHKIGPAVFSAYRTPGNSKIKLDAGLLIGVTDEAPDVTFRFEFEYEMY